MSFYGSSFSFDGVACEEFGLMLYDFNNTTQGNSVFGKSKIYEDRVPLRTRSLFYGADYEDALEFKLVFGADEYAASKGEDIDRQEMEAISMWLTGHNAYKWLTIDQPDMAGIRYRCIINDLEMVEVGFSKWALSCTVHCDSPFAYTYPMSYEYTVSGSLSAVLSSRSSINRPYLPKVTVNLPSGGDFSIENVETGATFQLKAVPKSVGLITFDAENGVLSCASGLNMYKYCNFKWPTLLSGDNHLNFTGYGTVTFTCEFPVNVGG